MGKQPLKGFTIAITGYFGEQRSMEQIRKWINVNGGTVCHDVSSEVTHLVCSKKDFKKDVAMGTGHIAILSRGIESILIRSLSLSPKGAPASKCQDRFVGLAGGYADEGTSDERT